jgi:hypothetical protein
VAESSNGALAALFAPARRGTIGLAFLVLGLILFAGYLVFNGGEHHSFNAGATPPTTVHVTGGKTYEISTPGGIPALLHRHLDPNAITCEYTSADGGVHQQQVSPLGSGSRTTHAVATFVAPVTGDIHLSCTGLTAGTFVDDADNSPGDPAGLLLLLSTISLGLAVPFGMSYLYRRSLEGPRDRHEVEAVVQPPAVDDEVVDPYRGDVGGEPS